MATAATRRGKTLALRRPDVCADCAVALPAGTRATWFPDTRTVRCLPCVEGKERDSSNQLPSPAPTLHFPSQPGGSAWLEYKRRSNAELAESRQAIAEYEAWRDKAIAERPIVGRLMVVLKSRPLLAQESQSTKAWKVGAEGERRVGERLDGLEDVLALHDLAVPNSRANIDHIAVAPTGVYLIDTKKYKGQIECRNVGGFFKSDPRLYVWGYDKTELVDRVNWQVAVIRKALGRSYADMPVLGTMCFVDGDFRQRPAHFTVDSVGVVGLSELAQVLQRPGPFSPERRQEVAHLLGTRLRPAAGLNHAG